MRICGTFLSLVILATLVEGQTTSLPGVSINAIACDAGNHAKALIITDPASHEDCTTGGGTDFPPHICECYWNGVSGVWRIHSHGNLNNDLSINGSDPSIVFNPPLSDTAFWLGVQDDAGDDDDDDFQIGKGTTTGTTPFFTIDHMGITNVSGAVNNFFLTAETTFTNGLAGFIAKNDARSWRMNVDAQDFFVIGDITGTTFPFVMEPGAVTNTIHLNVVGVGFGTPTPTAPLHIVSNLAEIRLQAGGASNSPAVTFINGQPQSWTIGLFGITDDFLISDGTASTTPLTIENGAVTDSFYVAASGDVGIGTSSPGSRMQVGAPSNSVDFYVQLDSESGAPPAGDCDNDAERGRMIHDFTNFRLYICGGASRGWDHLVLTN